MKVTWHITDTMSREVELIREDKAAGKVQVMGAAGLAWVPRAEVTYPEATQAA